jgi:hypothetical protein
VRWIEYEYTQTRAIASHDMVPVPDREEGRPWRLAAVTPNGEHYIVYVWKRPAEKLREKFNFHAGDEEDR